MASQAEAETLAALDSVFPQHGLRRFLSLSREDKARRPSRTLDRDCAGVVLARRLGFRVGRFPLVTSQAVWVVWFFQFALLW